MKCKFVKINDICIKFKCIRNVRASDVAVSIVLLDNSIIELAYKQSLNKIYQQFENMLNKYVQQRFVYRTSIKETMLDLDEIANNPQNVIDKLLADKFLERLKLACIGLYEPNDYTSNSFKYGGYKQIFKDDIIRCSVLKEAEPIEYYKNNMVFIGEVDYKGLTLVYYVDKHLYQVSGLEDTKILDYVISQAEKIKDNAKYYYQE